MLFHLIFLFLENHNGTDYCLRKSFLALAYRQAQIAKALGINVAELFTADDVFKDVNSIDKTLMEKISLIELLEKKEKAAFFTMLDALVSKKKLKDNLTSALQLSV